LRSRDLVSGVRLQSGIMHTFHFRMAREELCDFHCISGVRTHSPWQRAHAAEDQPAIERRGDRAALVLDAADALEKFVVRFSDHDSSENVAMPAEIFRGGMQDQIAAEIEWRLQHGPPCISANKKRADLA